MRGKLQLVISVFVVVALAACLHCARDRHRSADAPCAIRLAEDTIAESDDAVVYVRLDPNCEGTDWVLSAFHDVVGDQITIDATWDYEVVDDDGWCCGEEQEVRISGLTAGTYTVTAACFDAYAESCAEESDDDSAGPDYGEVATLIVTD